MNRSCSWWGSNLPPCREGASQLPPVTTRGWLREEGAPGCPNWLRGHCRFWARSWTSGGALQGSRKLSSATNTSAPSLEARERSCTVSKSSWPYRWAWPTPPTWLSPNWSTGRGCMRALIFGHFCILRNTDDPRKPLWGRLSWHGLLESRIAS